MKEEFINAIHKKQKVMLTFYSEEDGCQLTRKCAPMDYGPSRRARDQTPRFHFWDYESDEGPHTLSLLGNKIMKIEVLKETFDPGEFITWNTKTPPWFVPRDWREYS